MRRTREADKIVVALGSNSASLCRDIGVPCPVYPVKGHLVTVSSTFDYRHNLTLDGGIGYAAPMACVDSRGRRLYRLSGFVDFTPARDADVDRIEALVDATRSQLPDLEVVDASACHRPISADDRALIGPAGIDYPNLREREVIGESDVGRALRYRSNAVFAVEIQLELQQGHS